MHKSYGSRHTHGDGACTWNTSTVLNDVREWVENADQGQSVRCRDLDENHIRDQYSCDLPGFGTK